MQCWTKGEDVGPTLYKCYTHVLCLLGNDIKILGPLEPKMLIRNHTTVVNDILRPITHHVLIRNHTTVVNDILRPIAPHVLIRNHTAVVNDVFFLVINVCHSAECLNTTRLSHAHPINIRSMPDKSSASLIIQCTKPTLDQCWIMLCQMYC